MEITSWTTFEASRSGQRFCPGLDPNPNNLVVSTTFYSIRIEIDPADRTQLRLTVAFGALQLNRCFDVVIIEESAQAVEPANLVPLVNQCKKVFPVGDPTQLPATVISDVAKNHG
ncbi:hypothetical protein PIB30_083116, partial [Stylosanthes scabra]|nr:hypothetical protein [Stylosanthes scabra]